MPKCCKNHGCTLPIFSHEYCGRHQYLRTDEKWLRSIEKKKEKIMSKSHSSIKQKQKEPTGEKELFDLMWKASNKSSFISGNDLTWMDNTKYGRHPLFYNMFHHVLNKKNYSRYRLSEKNIIIITPQEHLDLHSLGREKLEIKYGKENIEKYFTLVEVLKDEYNVARI
jgi:hypothetical protein